MLNRIAPAPGSVRRRSVLAPVAVGLLLVATAMGCSATESATGTDVPAASQDEYKVTVAGDSISVGLGAMLRGTVDDDVVVKVIGEEGTGLARPDASALSCAHGALYASDAYLA